MHRNLQMSGGYMYSGEKMNNKVMTRHLIVVQFEPGATDRS